MRIIIISLLIFLYSDLVAQSEQGPNRHLPLIVTIQFHSLAVPFHNLKSNFKNLGIGIGTELNFSDKSDFHQRFSLIWYRNQAVGNGVLVQSQVYWRPTIGNDGFGETNLGLGYLLSKRPINSYVFKDGNWVSARKKGKGMFVLSGGLGLGYSFMQSDFQWNPFLGYQIMILNNYNRSVPL